MVAKRSIQRVLTTQIKLRQLALLKAVADHGTISAAANILHMSQPAVSKTIRELEELLGETLFERRATGVIATPFGDQFIRSARSVYAELNRAAEELTALRDGLGGTLTIGSYMVALPTLLPRALSFFLDADATTRVSVVEGGKEKLLEGLMAGQIDVVVGRMNDMSQQDSIRQTPLYFEPIVLVVGNRNPLAHKPDLSPADLGGQEWIMPPATSVVRTPINLFFVREAIAAPKRVIETVSYSVTRPLLMERNIVAALPWQVVQADINQGLLIQLPLEIGYPALPVGIITCEAHRPSSAATHMIECLHQAASELYHTPSSSR
jgi:molybdate transport repressor ModE-like protein